MNDSTSSTGTTGTSVNCITVPVNVQYNQSQDKYVASCPQGNIEVYGLTVINFLLQDAPPDMTLKGIVFTPGDTDQFSVPTVSTDGKMLTVIDASTTTMAVTASLKAVIGFDADQKTIPLSIDPQIRNQPR